MELTEKDLCEIRDAMAQERLSDALKSTETVLMKIAHREGYYKAIPFIPKREGY